MSLYFTDDEATSYRKDSETIQIHSKLSLLNAHNGLRRGKLHLVLGTTSGGKTTFIRTILRDFIFNPKNNDFGMGVWLSEESLDDYKSQLAYGTGATKELLRVQAFSELSLSAEDEEESFFEWARTIRPEVLVFDNITTSRFYEGLHPKAQRDFAVKLKMLAIEINSAIILVAHTDSKTKDGGGKLIQIEDIRGSRSIANLFEFAYIMQKIEINKNIYNVVNITKYRGQNPEERSFILKYDNKMKVFSSDGPIEFEKFKELYSARNKL